MYTRNRPTVYLCGPITGLSHDEARLGWRKQMRDELAESEIDAISPMRNKDHLKKEHDLSAEGYPEHLLSSPKLITTRDRWDTQRCDLVFSNLLGASRVSIGSMIELGWCDSMRIPMVVAMEDGNPHEHCMVRELGIIVSDLDTAVGLIKSFLIPSI